MRSSFPKSLEKNAQTAVARVDRGGKGSGER